MRGHIISAYFIAVLTSALAMDLAILFGSGAPSDWLSLDFLPCVIPIWTSTSIVILIGSCLPAALMIALSQRHHIRSLSFFIAWSCGAALILACIVTASTGPSALPPEDPDYLSFDHALVRIITLFEYAAFTGGLTYGLVLRWLLD